MKLFDLAKRLVRELEPEADITEELVVFPDNLWMGDDHFKKCFRERPITYNIQGERTSASVETAFTLPNTKVEWHAWEVPWESAFGVGIEELLQKRPLTTPRLNWYYSWKKEEKFVIPSFGELFETTNIKEQMEERHGRSFEPDDLVVLRSVRDFREKYVHYHVGVPRSSIHDMYTNQHEQFLKSPEGFPVVVTIRAPGTALQIPVAYTEGNCYDKPWIIKNPFLLSPREKIRSYSGKSEDHNEGINKIKFDLEVSYDLLTKVFKDPEVLELIDSYKQKN